jgi:hypothetical protein
MHTFSARSAGARGSPLATGLVRAVTYSLPTLLWTAHGQEYALTLALFLGAFDGWCRLRLARTARSLVAEADAMVFSSAFDPARVAWSDVLAIEVWHRLNRVNYAAVHYRTKAGNSVATCWEQGGREELLLFVKECAALAHAASPRRTITRACLRDRAVYLSLLRRLWLDVALALSVGFLCGIPSHAIWLGAAAGLLSGTLATTPNVRRSELVHRDGVWWYRRRNGVLTRPTVVPRSLRLWAGYLADQVGRQKPIEQYVAADGK